MMAPIEVEEPELQRLLPPWTFNDEAAYNEACARNHRWLRERMQLVLHGPDAPVMRQQKPEDEHKPIHKVPRNGASVAGRPRNPIALSMDDVRALLLKGSTNVEIAALAGCKVGVIAKMRCFHLSDVARTCPDCLQPTGRASQAKYCTPCAAKRTKALIKQSNDARYVYSTRTRHPKVCTHPGCDAKHSCKGLCQRHYAALARAPKPPRAQEAPCN